MGYADDILNLNKIKDKELLPSFHGKIMHLELSNICNNNCIFCPNHIISRKKIHMNKDLAFRIIKEAGELEIGELALFVLGEPFVTADLSSYVRHAKSCGIPYVFITTNGCLATHDTLKAVLDAGLDSIKFSINAGSQETYKIVHRNDAYNKVMDNLKFVWEYRKSSKLNYKILSSFVVTKYTENEIEKQKKAVAPYVDDFAYFYCETWGGWMSNEIKEFQVTVDNDYIHNSKKLPCPDIFNQIVVTAEGYLTLCCNDFKNYLAVEDLNKKSLKEAWHSETMAKIRKSHIENQIKGTLCYQCIYGGKDKVFPLNKELAWE